MLQYLLPGRLIQGLRDDDVPPAPIVGLMGVELAFQSLLGHPGFTGPLSYPAATPFALLHLGTALAALGISYHTHGGAKGRDFLGRFIALTTVLSFWIYVLAYALYVFTSWILLAAAGPEARAWFRPFGPAQLVFNALTSLALLLSLQFAFSRLAPRSHRQGP